jgi:3-dehydroquinate synthase
MNPAAVCRVPVDTGNSRYDILIGRGLLGDPATWEGLPRSAQAWVISNDTVAPLWAEPVLNALRARHAEVKLLTLPDGEAYKDWTTLNRIFDALLGAAADRKTLLLALGGGVVGDMTGFAAGCYMRGIPFVQVPTTLLAQVDSSVGGKTAVNHPLGKNMIGLFNQPLRVVCDLATLDTLPAREFSAGMAELIKYGPIADAGFFDWLDQHLDALMAREPATLARAIQRACEIKAQVVGQDEREAGLRAILNFGHTFGHAIETGLGYGQWLHGEAVAAGMVMAAHLSARLGLVPLSLAHRLDALLQRAQLPTRGPALGAARYLELMGHDKKTEAGRIRYVLLDALGSARIAPAEAALVTSVIEACCLPPSTPDTGP